MSDDAFVEPETIVLSLSKGRRLTVKKELNAGESEDLSAAITKTFIAGEKVELDRATVRRARMAAYIVDWNFTRAGERVKWTPAALSSLSTTVFNEIWDAIHAHEKASEAAIEERKNDPATVTASDPVLSSVGS